MLHSCFRTSQELTIFGISINHIFRINMKATTFLAGVAALVTQVAGHATFQDLWVNGVDKIRLPGTVGEYIRLTAQHVGTCARLPASNSPVTDVKSNNLRCEHLRNNNMAMN